MSACLAWSVAARSGSGAPSGWPAAPPAVQCQLRVKQGGLCYLGECARVEVEPAAVLDSEAGGGGGESEVRPAQ